MAGVFKVTACFWEIVTKSAKHSPAPNNQQSQQQKRKQHQFKQRSHRIRSSAELVLDTQQTEKMNVCK